MDRTVSKIRVAPIGGANTTQVNKDGTKIGLLGKVARSAVGHVPPHYTASVREHRRDTAEPLRWCSRSLRHTRTGTSASHSPVRC